MIKVLVVVAAGALASAVTPSTGHAQQMAAQTPPSTVKSVTGTVVDLSCKFGQGLAGKDHKMCAEVCADRGIPLAVLGDDGKLYLATSAGMPGDSQNSKLKPFAEARVTVTGKVFAAAGASAIQIDKIVAAK